MSIHAVTLTAKAGEIWARLRNFNQFAGIEIKRRS
jgi:hypothetical protein